MVSVSVLCMVSCREYLDVQPQGEVIPTTDEEFAAIMDNRIFDIEGGGDEFVIGNMEAIAKFEGYADNLDANIRVGNIVAYSGDNINIRQREQVLSKFYNGYVFFQCSEYSCPLRTYCTGADY